MRSSLALTGSRTAVGRPAVRRLAAGLLLSRTGDQLTTIALLWFVLDLTGSGAAVGLVLLCAGLPPVVTGPLLGRVLDRWPVRRVMVADNVLRAVLVGAIPALHWLGHLDLPVLCGLSVAAGALVPATDVGVRVVLPRLVDEDELEHANALLSIGDQVSALVGPACGGLLVGLVGAPPVLLLDAVSFLAMAAALLIVTGIAPAMLTLAVGGLIWAPYVTLESSLLQRLVPAHLLGRVFGVRRAVSAAAVPLGAAGGGLLLDHVPSTMVIGASAVTCILAGAAALCVPALHRLPARAQRAAAQGG
jgi:predicted MFS family arabinose efflux permease